MPGTNGIVSGWNLEVPADSQETFIMVFGKSLYLPVPVTILAECGAGALTSTMLVSGGLDRAGVDDT